MQFVDGGWELLVEGKPMIPPEAARHQCIGHECYPGIRDVASRLIDLDIEGVEKELLFPQRLFGIYMIYDLDIREHIYSAYNEYMATVCAQVPERLYFVGVPNYWNPSAARDSIQRIKELGARGLMVPINPRNDDQGKPINYASAEMDPFWAAAEESGLPVCFHVGEKPPTGGPGEAGNFVLVQMQGFRSSWGGLTFGGVFDRHPDLKVVFLEGGISWVASALHDADLIYNSFTMDPKLAMLPSAYWFRNCYATFMTDPAGLELLHRIGADRVMWSSDYPHPESTFGYTRTSIQKVFDATSVENAQKILGKTALKLFNMG
jgi:predicted TIM-barrel fold metal-dependent hydrolase